MHIDQRLSETISGTIESNNEYLCLHCIRHSCPVRIVAYKPNIGNPYRKMYTDNKSDSELDGGLNLSTYHHDHRREHLSVT